MKQLSRHMLIVWLLVSGCGGLQEIWEGPGAETFHPKSIAVLPPIVSQLEGAGEPAQEVVTAALKKGNRYGQVVDPDRVNAALQASDKAGEALANYYSMLETTGRSDKEAAVMLGQTLQAEALVVVTVESWEHVRTDEDKVVKVALGLRLIDATRGTPVWKARHKQDKSYLLFKPSLRDVAADLSAYMVKHMPR